MEFVKKIYERWEPAKICSKVKPLIRKLFSAKARPAQPKPAFRPDLLPFMTCIIKVDTSTRRWQKAVSRVMKTSYVRSFKMDNEGIVEVSGQVDPNQLLKALSRGGQGVKLCWFEYGECSVHLFGPPAAAAAPANAKKQNAPLECANGPIAIGYDKRFLPYYPLEYAYGRTAIGHDDNRFLPYYPFMPHAP